MQGKRWWRVASLLLFFSISASPSASIALEKLRIGTTTKENPLYNLPMLAAEEKGFWKMQGLEVEWVPFAGGGSMYQAMVAGAIDLGVGTPIATIQVIARGAPLVIVADTKAIDEFVMWVRKDGPMRVPSDLKGAKIGVARFGQSSQAYARVALKGLGLERDVKFVAMGGVQPAYAGVKVGAIDGVMFSKFSGAPLMFKGEVRILLSSKDFLPKPWPDVVITAPKDFAEKKKEAVRSGLKAFLQSAKFVMAEREWTVEKLKSFFGHPEAGARSIYSDISYGTDFKIEAKGLQNVLNFLVEYDLLPKGKVPALDQIIARGVLD